MIQLSEHEKIALNAAASIEMVKLMEKHYSLPKDKVIEILYGFEDIHGVDAVIALWGWWLNCQYEKIPDVHVWAVISTELCVKVKGINLVTAPFFGIAQDHFFHSYIYNIVI